MAGELLHKNVAPQVSVLNGWILYGAQLVSDNKQQRKSGQIVRGRSEATSLYRLLIVILACVCCLWPLSARTQTATNYPTFESALSSQLHKPFTSAYVEHTESSRPLIIGLASIVFALVVFRLALPRLGRVLNGRNPWLSAKRRESSETILPEQESFNAFADRFRAGSHGESGSQEASASPEPAGAAASTGAKKESKAEAARQEKPPKELTLEEFFQAAPGSIAALRKLFSEISHAAMPAAKQQALGKLAKELDMLKNEAERLKLIPAWQMATALYGLIHQLSEKPAQMTPSNLRTAAGGLLVLESLCTPGVDPELATRLPARFLAVDDEPITRRVVGLALKKVFLEPDLAENGEAALKFASTQSYDAIFLDVEMPGMDGYEVCAKLHETEPNRNTPVVFVTSHNDFASREKSASCGGRDLIAKPFLAFEITVKALALVLNGRLDRAKAKGAAASAERPASDQPASKAPADKNTAADSGQSKVKGKASAATAPKPVVTATSASSRTETQHRFRTMETHLAQLGQAMQAGKQQKIFEELYAGFNSILSEADQGGLKAAYHLASSGGNLARKLLEKPALCTPSTIHALGEALPLLQDLISGTKRPDISNPPIRVLLVDDEPLARRAVGTALQLTFGKPDQAESGEAAVELAAGKQYDVIFMDVIMPGIDGFEACSKIRDGAANTTTPIVFVTSQKDAASREKATASGGNGFISKPVLPAEISLTAFTFAIRARMATPDNSKPVQELAEAVS